MTETIGWDNVRDQEWLKHWAICNRTSSSVWDKLFVASLHSLCHKFLIKHYKECHYGKVDLAKIL